MHQHIQVIIPGDKALMPDGTQKCTGKQKIGNVQLPANSVEFLQKNRQCLLMLLQGSRFPLLCQRNVLLGSFFHTATLQQLNPAELDHAIIGILNQ